MLKNTYYEDVISVNSCYKSKENKSKQHRIYNKQKTFGYSCFTYENIVSSKWVKMFKWIQDRFLMP